VPVASVTYDAASNTAVFNFAGLLPNGNYRATIAAAGITDASGNSMPAGFTFDFYFLAGDINGDRAVNGTDFAILAANFGRTGQTYATGDLNGDGSVNGSDFAILAGNFGRTVPAALTEVVDAAGVAAGQPARAFAAPRSDILATSRRSAVLTRARLPRRRPLPMPKGPREF